MPAPQPSWTAHADIIIPAVEYAVKAMVSTILAIGGALIATLIWIGKRFINRVDNIDTKLTRIEGAMELCDGCSDAMDKYGRRHGDFSEGSEI